MVSNTGDKLGSVVLNLVNSVTDLFLGNPPNLASSLTLEHKSLGELNLLIWLSSTLSYPWSTNDISEPPSLVPETDLNWLDIEVSVDGVNTLNDGINASYWKFCDPTVWFAPPILSSVKLTWFTPVDLSNKLGLPAPLLISKK